MNALRSGLWLALLVACAALAGTPASAEAGKSLGRDGTPPTVTCPSDLTIEAAGPLGAYAYFSASATDDRNRLPTITYSTDPGSLFPLGTTTVTVTATDWKGNSSTCTFDVTVQDTTPPTLTVPGDIWAEPTGSDGAIVSFGATASDRVDPEPTITYSHESGGTFPIGTTTVTVTATDDYGNYATGTFDVTVDDDATDSPFAGTYAWPWTTVVYDDSWNVVEEVVYYEWTITISGDGTVSGVGSQKYLIYDWAGGAIEPMPSDLSASGVVDGLVSDVGVMQADVSYSLWAYSTGWGTDSELYEGFYEFQTGGQASLDVDGNLVITNGGHVETWYRQ